MKQLIIDAIGAFATTRNATGTTAQWFIPRELVQHLDLAGMRAEGWSVTDYRTDEYIPVPVAG